MTTVEIWGARAGQTQSRLFEEIRKCREAGQRVLLLFDRICRFVRGIL